MKKKEQAEAYLREAELTFKSAKVIYNSSEEGEEMWAQVVKNAYDAMEQALSAAIASKGKKVPRSHPAKVMKYLDLFQSGEEVKEILLKWLDRRSESQYVDTKGGELMIPHELFNKDDAHRILKDTESVLRNVKSELEL